MVQLKVIKQIHALVQAELKNHIEEKTRQNSQKFFKETIQFYGVPVPQVNRIGKRILGTLQGFSKPDVYACCELLWKSGYIEESFIACQWAYELRASYVPDDVPG